MHTLNSADVDTFLWEHRENGSIAVKDPKPANPELPSNIAWRDCKTGQEIPIIYKETNRS